MANKDVKYYMHAVQTLSYSPVDKFDVTGSSVSLISATPTVEESSNSIFSDGRSYATMTGASTLTYEVTQWATTELEKIQAGWGALNGGYIETGVFPSFNAQYITLRENLDGSGTQEVLTVLYNVQSGSISESDDTDDDNVNPIQYTRTFNVNGLDEGTLGGTGRGVIKRFQIARTEDNATVFDTWTTKILTPKDFEVKP